MSIEFSRHYDMEDIRKVLDEVWKQGFKEGYADGRIDALTQDPPTSN